MSKELKKAGERLLWRLSPKENGDHTTFKANENDFNALKTILGHINRQEKISVKNQSLFAKLFIYELTMEIRNYQTTVLNPFPLQKLSSLLSKPIEVFYDAFYSDLINNQLNRLTDFDNINKQIEKDIKEAEENYPNYEGITSKEDYIKSKRLEMISDEKQIEVLKDYSRLKETFTLDFVVDKLNGNIAEAINKFS